MTKDRMISFIHIRRLHTPMIVLALATIVGLGAFESFKIIHEIYEPNCAGKTTGNASACIFCAHFQLVAAEATPELAIPESDQIVGIIKETKCLRPSLDGLTLYPARAPPAIT